MKSSFQLYSYYRSSASYRVRIGLNLKTVEYDYIPIHLKKDGGQQFSETYQNLNPMNQVPCLVHNDQPITQSLAILLYLDRVVSKHRLFPENNYDFAKVLEVCEIVNSGIQPLQNLSVTTELENSFQATNEQTTNWIRQWVTKGLNAVESIVKKTSGDFCFGNNPNAADCFLVPQIFSAKRFGVTVDSFPTILKIAEAASGHEAFRKAEPKNQPDAE